LIKLYKSERFKQTLLEKVILIETMLLAVKSLKEMSNQSLQATDQSGNVLKEFLQKFLT
jgi:hypothetical protein